MIEEIVRQKYNNAKQFFYQNWDNPQYAQRALREYRECADVLYYFEKGERIRKVNSTIKSNCEFSRECPSHDFNKCSSQDNRGSCGKLNEYLISYGRN